MFRCISSWCGRPGSEPVRGKGTFGIQGSLQTLARILTCALWV